MKLLIAEDEKDLAEGLQVLFEKNQFIVDVVNNGEDALDYGLEGKYDVIILDIMMPKKNGIEVLEELRRNNIKTPIMMLTAKTQKEDRITGYDAGADDYLPKPFDADELISRVRALLRRSGDYQDNKNIVFDDLTFDSTTALLKCNNDEIRLNGKEFQLMELFIRNPGKVYSAENLMERIWGWDSDSDTSVVWVHISNLRKKLKSLNSNVTISVSRGLGYVLGTNNDK